MIVNAGYRGKVGAAVPKFTYTGDYNVRDDGVVELLTSGTITFLNPTVIDIFCVGGGGKGGDPTIEYRGGGGGGGGLTTTVKKATVNGFYTVTIGAGSTKSSPVSNSEPLVRGGTTSFGELASALGGVSAVSSGWKGNVNGADGGSGGGAGVSSNHSGGMGGSDGNNGENGSSYAAGETATGGSGQGSTTREFGEAAGKLYGGGGGGGRYMVSSTPIISIGGVGGGGAGGFINNSNLTQAPGAGGANTGGGGGGTARGTSFSLWAGSPANGGSGICCIRAAK